MNIKKYAFHLAMPTVLFAYTMYSRLENVYVSLPYHANYGVQETQVADIYEPNIELSRAKSSVNTYVPKYLETEWYTAKMYAGFFGMEQEVAETMDYYSFSNGRAVLYVYKHTNLVHYELNNEFHFEGDNKVIFSDTDALAYACEFIEGNFLYLNYEEADISYEDGVYTIMLINRLGNMKNYAFPNKIVLNEWGSILSLEYYFVTYEKLGSKKTRSMYEAFQMLPSDYQNGITITINDCSLIYIYKNSIVQPAYHFTGISSDLTYFECFIEASTY